MTLEENSLDEHIGKKLTKLNSKLNRFLDNNHGNIAKAAGAGLLALGVASQSPDYAIYGSALALGGFIDQPQYDTNKTIVLDLEQKLSQTKPADRHMYKEHYENMKKHLKRPYYSFMLNIASLGGFSYGCLTKNKSLQASAGISLFLAQYVLGKQKSLLRKFKNMKQDAYLEGETK